jgi:cytidylate kinase
MTADRVVAIDGAAGSGKSTLARTLARRLRLAYVNTGLMYRALAAAALRSTISPADEGALVGLMGTLRFTIGEGDPPSLEVEGYTAAELTTAEVERVVSAVARHPAVRAVMRDAQREIGLENGGVVEGRDIGSVVFPDAAVKLYLVADAAARSARRADERAGDDELVAVDLKARDDADARTNPFVPPEGAEVIDTGRLSIGGTVDAALGIVRRRAPWLLEGAGP